MIGLPGDKIQMMEGRLYINGQIVPREPIAKVTTTDQFGQRRRGADLQGDAAGRRDAPDHRARRRQRVLFDNTAVFEVPPDHYFMMGDNRDNSTDSRVAPEQGGVGYVPFENFVGRAEIIFFSIDEGDAGLGVLALAVDGALGSDVPAGAMSRRRRTGRPRRARSSASATVSATGSLLTRR